MHVRNIFLPVNLPDFAKLPPGITKDGIFYILRRILSCKEKDLRENGLVPISGELMNLHIHDYKKTLNYLFDEGIIVRDGTFTVGKKCMAYAFTEQYRDAVEFKCEEYEHDKRKKKPIDAKVQKQLPHLSKWLYALRFDCKAAESSLLQEYEIKVALIKEKKLLPTLEREEIKTINKKYMRLLNVASSFADQEFSRKLDKHGRLHSSVPLMNREILNLKTFFKLSIMI